MFLKVCVNPSILVHGLTVENDALKNTAYG